MTKTISPKFSEQLSAAADVDSSVAAVVLETAVDYVVTLRPDLGPRLERLLADEGWTARAARLIGRLGRSVRSS